MYEQNSNRAQNYHLLRHALERFHCRPADLGQAQRREVEQASRQSLALETRVLASAEAAAVTIPEAQVEAALAQVRARYATEEDFLADLDANRIDLDSLRQALARELKFDAVLRRVAQSVPAVTDAEVAAWYQAHPEQTRLPERRQVRHILVTINAAFPENRREAARARIEAIAAALRDDPAGFATMARERSECPSALEGGLIGQVVRGQLFPALDLCLFQMAPGSLSGILESEMGFHLLWCEAVEPARSLPLEEVRERLREQLREQRRRQRQREWIRGLGDVLGARC